MYDSLTLGATLEHISDIDICNDDVQYIYENVVIYGNSIALCGKSVLIYGQTNVLFGKTITFSYEGFFAIIYETYAKGHALYAMYLKLIIFCMQI